MDETVADTDIRLRKGPHSCELFPLLNQGTRPRLLVSVRSLDEAALALAGGAEILDVKEPSLGSLGMASIGEIAEITTMSDAVSHSIPISVALGEVADWTQASKFPSLPKGILYAKMGLSRCTSDANWRENWERIRVEFERRSNSNIKWVAVAYADSTEADSPGIAEVLQAAIEMGCAGLLIDTWTKDGRTLLDEISESTIKSLSNQCHAAGLFLALAGKLGLESVPALARVSADVLAIRSAACRGTERTSELDADCVRDFRNEMNRVFDRT